MRSRVLFGKEMFIVKKIITGESTKEELNSLPVGLQRKKCDTKSSDLLSNNRGHCVTVLITTHSWFCLLWVKSSRNCTVI